MRLLQASLLKLVLRPATRRTVLVLAAALTFIYLTVGVTSMGTSDPQARSGLAPLLVFPDAHASLASMLLMFGGIVGAGYAGTVAASEWSWNTLRAALARGESRVRYLVGLFIAIALLALVAWLALYAMGIGAILLAASIGGLPASDPFSVASRAALPIVLAAGGWALVMQIGIGFGISFISRSAVAGVATVVCLTFIEQLAGVANLPADLMRLAPVTAATSLVRVAGGPTLDAALWLPLAVTTFYVLLPIGLAAAFLRRAQVS